MKIGTIGFYTYVKGRCVLGSIRLTQGKNTIKLSIKEAQALRKRLELHEKEVKDTNP